MNLNKPKTAILIFLFITLIFSYPIYSRINSWGMHDWDQHLFYEGVPRTSILEFHQFPLWNPYQCGGNVMLANPQSSFISIHFTLTLLLGEVIATKIAILLYLFLGMLGMWFLCRQLNMQTVSSYIPPIILFLGGVYAIRMTVGHTNWFYLAYIPWIFYFYIKQETKYIIPASFLLALIFLGGGIHPFIIAVTILTTYTLFTTIKNKNTKAIKLTILLFLLFFPFASIKLVPTLAVYNEMLPIEQTDIQPNSFTIMLESLTNRNSDITQVYYSEDGYPWSLHEYYSYIGVLPILLFVISIILWKKEYWEYIAAAFFIIFLILSQNIFPVLWKFIYSIPGTSIFHGLSRLLFALIFFIAVSVGFALTHLEKKKNKQLTFIIIIILFFLVTDLTLVNSSLFKKGLYIEPQKAVSTDEFYTLYAEDKEFFTQQYLTFLNNKGIWNCYERFYPAVQGSIPKATFNGAEYSDYHGEAYIAGTNDELQITYFSPNKVIIKTNSQEGTLVLNQNYVIGWKVKVDGKRQEVTSTKGAVSTAITKDNKEVIFYYLPNSFIMGFIITIITILLSIIYYYNY
ncbi:hypothetical protein COV16_02525 [Candidatus Woesearchaeota archaeon CG10_big_fil_rev_8_21_14_0_10_34_8]|nr:MAG: hypothetical protein COV16_02525 [Candidatus Woesearchaeota archaeon CG10_big_fil_rev_8_21_14_0_10_34_8]